MNKSPDRVSPPVVLTIAGFDPSSGAGATADLQVFASFGLFGTACLTALTVQSTLGVASVRPVDAELLREMLRCLVSDMPPAGIKIGMLGNLSVTKVVGVFLEELSVREKIPVVVDPVLRSSSGKALLQNEAREAFLREVCPRATCLTPNRDELAVLTGQNKLEDQDLDGAAQMFLEATGVKSVIVTGGDSSRPDDLLLEAGREPVWLAGQHVETNSTHGTGCAFSSALLSRLVLGDDLLAAARAAKSFVEMSLRSAPGLGSGKGPMKLTWPSAIAE